VTGRCLLVFAKLESSGGAPYLAALADGMPRVSNVEHYARIVREKALLRNLIHATHNIQQRALEGEDGADTILDNAESSIFALAEDRVKAGLIPSKTSFVTILNAWKKSFAKAKASLASRPATPNWTNFSPACSRQNS